MASWGIAWYVNGILIPELYLVRGETYTFRVTGGLNPTQGSRYHPLYITDSVNGGYPRVSIADDLAVNMNVLSVGVDVATLSMNALTVGASVSTAGMSELCGCGDTHSAWGILGVGVSVLTTGTVVFSVSALVLTMSARVPTVSASELFVGG